MRKHSFGNWPFVVIVALAGAALVAAPAAADRALLITSCYPSESDSSVLAQPKGGGGLNFISGGPNLGEPQAIRFGPDGNLYVLSEASLGNDEYAVYRYNGSNGTYIGTFVAAGSGGLTEGKDMTFGPDNHLYITANEGTGPYFGEGGRVLRFNGTTGAPMGVFVANGSGGANDEEKLSEATGLAFGPDGHLYVGNEHNNAGTYHNVLKFNGSTGAFMSVHVASNSNGLYDADFFAFGPDNHLYISNEGDGTNDDSVLRFNGSTGAFIDVFVASGSGGLSEPKGLAFDVVNGDLYVVGGDSPGGIYRYSSSTGNFIDVYVPEDNSNMSDSRGLVFYLAGEAIPILGGWSLALLAAVILALGGWLVYRMRS